MESLKRTKKCMVLLLLTMLVSIFAIPTNASAAAKINKKSISIDAGRTYTLKVIGTKSKITWSSSNRKIATVSQKGLVKGLKPGKCTIAAKYGKSKLTCKVTVKKALISVSATSCKFTNTKKKSIKVTYNGDDSIYWESSNTNVATCIWSKKWLGNTTTLYVVPKGNGTAKIKIYDDSKKKTVTINVTVNASAFKKDLLTELKEGLKVQLIVPSVGSSQNYYCQVKFTNNTGHNVSLTSMVYANGKGCSNLAAMDYIVEDGYYTVWTFKRGFYTYTKDMYLDNMSKAWTMIKVDGEGYAVKFDVNGNTEIGKHPQDLGIY